MSINVPPIGSPKLISDAKTLKLKLVIGVEAFTKLVAAAVVNVVGWVYSQNVYLIAR